MSATSMRQLAEASCATCRTLANASSDTKNAALRDMARALRADAKSILSANEEDLAEAKAAGRSAAFLDRLALTPARIEAMAEAVEAIVALPDPVGEITERWKRPNGLQVSRMRLPLGVLLMIYEARPNVTSDAAALALKSGNAVILRGGREALRSNGAIARALRLGLISSGLPAEAVTLVTDVAHASLGALLELEGLIDLCIPRGGQGLVKFVHEHARIPVVEHAEGVCHVYVHADADPKKAEDIVLNAKTHRPGVCNAAECLLIDSAVAPELLPRLGSALSSKGVTLKACPIALPLLERSGVEAVPAAPDDFGREFLDLTMAVRVVPDLDAALDHIGRFGSEHTEALVSEDRNTQRRFVREVAASAVVVNASTRFNDGGELGLGAEIGISTSRMHAFGPMGLRELTSQKYVIHGTGQVR